MAKRARVYTGTGWDDLAVQLPDLSNYSTTSQMNTAITNAVGLIKIASVTLTGSTGQVFTGLTAGSKYRILLDMNSNTNNNFLNLRFRQGSTDVTSGYYGAAGYTNNVGGQGVYTTQLNGSTISILKLTTAANELGCAGLDLFIQGNQDSARITGTAYASFERVSTYINYENTAVTTVDGFNIYPVTGTMTGTINLYKYQD